MYRVSIGYQKLHKNPHTWYTPIHITYAIIILFTLFDFSTTWSPSYKIKKAGDMTFLLYQSYY